MLTSAIWVEGKASGESVTCCLPAPLDEWKAEGGAGEVAGEVRAVDGDSDKARRSGETWRRGERRGEDDDNDQIDDDTEEGEEEDDEMDEEEAQGSAVTFERRSSSS